MILITGAGGTVSSALVNALKGSDHPLRLAFHTPEKAARAAAAGYDVVTYDYHRPTTLAPALDGVTALFLLGNGIVGQAEGEVNVVEAARAAGVERLVKLSVWGADEEAFALAALHRSIERAIEASGLAWTFLRPNNFMQGFLTYDAASIRAEGAFYLPAGEARVNHVDVRDIAGVAALALTAPGHAGKAYALSGPQALSYTEAATLLSTAIGRPVRYVAVSDASMRAALLAEGAPAPYVDYLVDLYQYFRSGGAAGLSPDVRLVTGREPIAFAQFAREYAAAFA
jgi:uncharacterized protein YbjT (DUF2867 family)